MNIKQKLHGLRVSCKSFKEYQRKSKAVLMEHDERIAASWLENEFEAFLSTKTCVHQIHRKAFTDDELKKAFLFYTNSYSDSKCEDDHACRLAIYKGKSCYLHWLLNKKAAQQIKDEING